MAMDRLNVSRNVSLDDMRQFALDAGDKKIRVKTEGGDKILYTSNKTDLGVRNFFTGHSEKREAKARTLIERELGFVQLSNPGKGVKGSELHKTLDSCGPAITVPKAKGAGTHTAPSTVRFGDTTYTHDGHIATKGYGHVHRYRDNDGNAIAVKILTNRPTTPTAEFMMHRQANDGGKGVIGIHGALVNPTDGTVLIGMDLAVGDCEHVTEKLNEKVQNGEITQAVANAVRMTMLHDMAKGVAQVNGNGVVHYDVKPDNFLVNGEGKAVVTDFGTSGVGENSGSSKPSLMISPKQVTDLQGNKFMRPPELTKQIETKFVGFHNAKDELLADLKKEFMAKNGFPEDSKISHIEDRQVKERMTKEWEVVKAEVGNHPKLRHIKLSSGADSWGLGLTAHQMMEGMGAKPQVFTGRGTANEEAMIGAFSDNKNNRIYANVQNPMQGLVNGLMHPDKDKRTTPAELVVDTAFFQTPGFGSPEVRELIKSLATGDDDGIQRYSQAVQNLNPQADANRRAELLAQQKDEILGEKMREMGF